MRILQVNTTDMGGGAESVAWQLFQGYRNSGHISWLAVGSKESHDADVFPIPQDEFRHSWAKTWLGLAERIKPLVGVVRGAARIQKLCRRCIGQPGRWVTRACGIEDFSFPGTWHLADLPPATPDILQCHNMHGAWLSDGGYFDLTILPWLSHRFPVVVTLHDAWLLSGHCAHSFDCERWKTGCGSCPDLTIYPSIRRDATAHNWTRKQSIFSKSRLYISAPSRWLMHKVQQSMLAPAIVESRVIPNGVNLAIFHPEDKKTVRVALGIPHDQKVVLFAAHGVRENRWKDYSTMRAAIEEVGTRLQGEEVLFVALGDEGNAERVGRAQIRFIPFTRAPGDVARYYQAADVYLHAARADTFPNTILEALACGIPVVATAVGGIPEQVHDGKTGFLVPSGDVGAMATSIVELLSKDDLRRRFGQEAAHVARTRFDLQGQVNTYLSWFGEILQAHKDQATDQFNLRHDSTVASCAASA
jgi:glycosyltransferase involved in cell wall biosynthesis